MADDEAGAGKDAKPWVIVGKGEATDEQLAAACDRSVEVKATIAALLDAAGPRWTALLLRKELARIDPPPPPRPAHRPRKGKIDTEMLLILSVERGNLSAPNLAKRLLAEARPGFAQSAVALKERINRARRYMQKHSEEGAGHYERFARLIPFIRGIGRGRSWRFHSAWDAASRGKLLERVAELFMAAPMPMTISEILGDIVQMQFFIEMPDASTD